ncbi:MAG: UDP-N-acetylglucosamine 2-epimerase, partial [Bacteroidota bacterium]
LTLRENTERPVTVELGTNELCGLDVERVVKQSSAALEGTWKKGRVPDLWDGKTAERIASIISKRL